jgi:hypothetical protein
MWRNFGCVDGTPWATAFAETLETSASTASFK